MARRQADAGRARFASLALFLIGAVSFTVAYIYLSGTITPTAHSAGDVGGEDGSGSLKVETGGGGSECCRGIEHLELWGPAVNWGVDFKLNAPEECCQACKAMCDGGGGPCLCDSWVFCGDREACGPQFGECWLKKQKDSLAPEKQVAGPLVKWTSGVIFGEREGIIGLETEYGTIHIKLFSDCAPHSVDYILDLLKEKHCAGCQFYRAESRGTFWDSDGNHLKNAPFGPPYALIQGTLGALGTAFPEIPTEACPTIRRGSVAWVGNGPEFFISLANHREWRNSYTVFASVLPDDMIIVERIARLPTMPDVWNNVNVSVLEHPISLLPRRRIIGQKGVL